MPPVFRYATLEAVKARIPADLLTSSGFTDAQVLEQIEQASAAINEWTRQWFQPVPETAVINGRGDQVVTHPLVVPSLRLVEAVLNNDRTTGEFREMDRIIPGMRHFPEAFRSGANGSMESQFAWTEQLNETRRVAWEPGSRTLNLISLFSGFTRGWKNVNLTGWWGWLEGLKSVEVALSTALPANTLTTTSVVVASVTDAVTGDYIEVGDTIAIAAQTPSGALVPKRVELAIVRAIAGAGPFTLTVNALHPYPFSIPVGSKVFCFGRVPGGLAQVAVFLASRFVVKRIAEATGDTDALVSLALVDGTLRSERTDNYSYSLGGADGGGGGGGSKGQFTGSAQMDLLLKKFGQPAVSIALI